MDVPVLSKLQSSFTIYSGMQVAQNNFISFISGRLNPFSNVSVEKQKKDSGLASFRTLPFEIREKIYNELSNPDLRNLFEADAFLRRQDGYACVMSRLSPFQVETTLRADGYAPALLNCAALSYRLWCEPDSFFIERITAPHLRHPPQEKTLQNIGIKIFQVPGARRRHFYDYVRPIAFSRDGRYIIAKRSDPFAWYDLYSNQSPRHFACDSTWYVARTQSHRCPWWRDLIVVEKPATSFLTHVIDKLYPHSLLHDPSLRATDNISGRRILNFTHPVFFADGKRFLAHARTTIEGKYLKKQIIGLFDGATLKLIKMVEILDADWPDSVRACDSMEQIYFKCRHTLLKKKLEWVFWDKKSPLNGIRFASRKITKNLVMTESCLESQKIDRLAKVKALSEKYLDADEPKKVVLAPEAQIACVYGEKTGKIVAVDLRVSSPLVHWLMQEHTSEETLLFADKDQRLFEPTIHFSPDGNMIGIVAQTYHNTESAALFSSHDHFSLARHIYSKSRSYKTTGILIPSSDSVTFIVSGQESYSGLPSFYLVDSRDMDSVFEISRFD